MDQIYIAVGWDTDVKHLSLLGAYPSLDLGRYALLKAGYYNEQENVYEKVDPKAQVPSYASLIPIAMNQVPGGRDAHL